MDSIIKEREYWEERGANILADTCEECKEEYSSGYDWDSGASQGSWDFYKPFDKNICYACISKISSEELEKWKARVAKEREECRKARDESFYVHDPCVICQAKTLRRHIRSDKRIEACLECRNAVENMKKLSR